MVAAGASLHCPNCGLRLSAQTPKNGYPAALATPGDHIRAARLDRGLVQAAVAKQLQVSESTVNNWERGRTEPDLRLWPRLLAWLGYNPEPPGQTLGQRVARRRRELGWTQEELAARLGTDEGSVQAWEAGQTTPNETNWRLLEAFSRTQEET
ncbi:MAG TPA: helix-turn-helix domain-containing protein [Myxococcaceae bacterium]|nr:helix-turn-helix domain-containing protein [Myxococcaceae bacterium]